MKIVKITINIYMIYTNICIYTVKQKRVKDKHALMGVSSKWRIMYRQMRDIK